MDAQPLARPEALPEKTRGSYTLIARDFDGRWRVERFDDAAAYRRRLATLSPAERRGVSIDDIACLLDA